MKNNYNVHDTIENDGTWRGKAHRLIRVLCEQEYSRANPDPVRRSMFGYKAKPYHVPDLARDLVDCLNRDDEHTAKALFHSYEGMKAIGA